MSLSSFYNDYKSYLTSNYPSLNASGGPDVSHLATSAVIPITAKAFAQMTASVKALYTVCHSENYKRQVQTNHTELLDLNLNQASVLMAYDFHLDVNGNAKLIEVNTNAAGYLFTEALYKVLNLQSWSQAFEGLQQAFAQEKILFDDSKIRRLALIDENVTRQNMFPEFQMYIDLFKTWQIEADIYEFSDLNVKNNALVNPKDKPIDFVYNRYCDFLFERKESQPLRHAYLNKLACFSPHPMEYLLSADKQRLVEMSREQWLKKVCTDQELVQAIMAVLIPTQEVSDFSDPDQLWDMRKKLFFKPKRAFGGKATYRGSSISRKMFERLLNDRGLAQEYVPAPSIWLEHTGEKQQWKYDVRLYAYKDRVDLACARIYQGQVTNFRTPGGGFAPIKIT